MKDMLESHLNMYAFILYNLYLTNFTIPEFLKLWVVKAEGSQVTTEQWLSNEDSFVPQGNIKGHCWSS